MKKSYEPTQKTIRNRCTRLRSKWSEREKNKRLRIAKAKEWLPPTIKINSLKEAADEQDEETSQI